MPTITFPAKNSEILAVLGSSEGCSEDSTSDFEALCPGYASDEEVSLDAPTPSAGTSSGSRRKKRLSKEQIHSLLRNPKHVKKQPTVEAVLTDMIPDMAHYYGTDQKVMKRLVSNPGHSNCWYACLLTTDSSRKTSTHVSSTRSPFRKAALHSLGLVQTKATRNAKWRLRLIVGPFGTKTASERFKRHWKLLCRKCTPRMTKGLEEARKAKVDFYFPCASDLARFGSPGE